jgi:DNA-binding response OmpR family regulator
MNLNRILVVDEEPRSRRALRSMLAAQRYEVHEARTIESALRRLGRNRIDLVILGSNLPGLRKSKPVRRSGPAPTPL